MVLSVENLSFSYEGSEVRALDGVSFSIRKGEWVTLVGHNGSGKSTLAKLLIGLYFGEGKVTVGDYHLRSETIWEVRKQIGMVFQNPDNQFVGTTVEDDVAFGLENAGVPQKEMVQRVQQALKLVGMEQFLNQEPHHLSGGQKQRVALASVLALEPSIIILDEATSMLDPVGKVEVLETINELRKSQDIAILSITHDLEEAVKADRMLVLNQGRLFAVGVPEQIFQQGDELKAIGLDLPFHLQIAQELTKQGIDLGAAPRDLKGVVSALCRFNSIT